MVQQVKDLVAKLENRSYSLRIHMVEPELQPQDSHGGTFGDSQKVFSDFYTCRVTIKNYHVIKIKNFPVPRQKLPLIHGCLIPVSLYPQLPQRSHLNLSWSSQLMDIHCCRQSSRLCWEQEVNSGLLAVGYCVPAMKNT